MYTGVNLFYFTHSLTFTEVFNSCDSEVDSNITIPIIDIVLNIIIYFK